MAASQETAQQLTLAQLPQLLQDDHSVKVGGTDIDGQMRGKLMSKKKFLSIAESGFGFCSVIFGWDQHDQTYFKELKISNAENGYRDILAKVDLSTYRRIPWENNVPFFLCSFREPDGNSLSACPRSVLERACSKIGAKGIGAMAGGKMSCIGIVLKAPTSMKSAMRHSTSPPPLTRRVCVHSRIRILPVPHASKFKRSSQLDRSQLLRDCDVFAREPCRESAELGGRHVCV